MHTAHHVERLRPVGAAHHQSQHPLPQASLPALDAGIHSREVATPEVAMRFVSYLLDGDSTDADVHWLVDQHDIWVMPLFNPDGHFIVEHGNGREYALFQRKNADRDDGQPLPATRHYAVWHRSQSQLPLQVGLLQRLRTCRLRPDLQDPPNNLEEETQAVTARIRQLVPDQRGPDDTDASPITATVCTRISTFRRPRPLSVGLARNRGAKRRRPERTSPHI